LQAIDPPDYLVNGIFFEEILHTNSLPEARNRQNHTTPRNLGSSQARVQ
jgi:hypothetical protein